MTKVYEKLNKVQVKLNAPKNQYNSFGKYSYRSCEDVLEGLKPLLKEVGAVVTITDDIVIIGEAKEGVSNIYVKATASFIDAESGEAVSVSALARHADTKKGMDDAQVTGATSSYARKYALNGLFCIDDNKDPDALEPSNTSAKTTAKPKEAKPTPKEEPKKKVTQATFDEGTDDDFPF